jgi:hypothetical protein
MIGYRYGIYNLTIIICVGWLTTGGVVSEFSLRSVACAPPQPTTRMDFSELFPSSIFAKISQNIFFICVFQINHLFKP